MILISETQNVKAKPAEVAKVLLDHQALDRFFNAKFVLVNPENQGELPGGKGAIRQINMLGSEFQEKIISADEHHIKYQIMGNKPVAEHCGDIYLKAISAPQTKTEINDKLRCTEPWWQPSFVVAFFIKTAIQKSIYRKRQ